MNSFSELWYKVQKTDAIARRSGSIVCFESTTEVVSDGGLQWIIRFAPSLMKKPSISTSEAKLSFFDPFDEKNLDRNVYIDTLFGTHNLLLNKFCVLPLHVVLVTKVFQYQDQSLNEIDFRAIWHIMTNLDPIVFFNCGKNSGASQPHKHIQAIPLSSFGDDISDSILSPELVLLKNREGNNDLFRIPQFLFRHICCKIEQGLNKQLTTRGIEEFLTGCYQELLTENLENEMQSYNFIMTRKWMLLVPRSRENFISKNSITISLNSLAFIRLLLAKNEDELQLIKTIGPLEILKSVTFP